MTPNEGSKMNESTISENIRLICAFAQTVETMRCMASDADVAKFSDADRAGFLRGAIELSASVDAQRDGLRGAGLPARVIAAVVANPAVVLFHALVGDIDALVSWAAKAPAVDHSDALALVATEVA